MRKTEPSRRAIALARSIAASSAMEGQPLTDIQKNAVAAVIDGHLDADTAIREFEPTLARRVHKAR